MERSTRMLTTGALGVLMLLAGSAFGGASVVGEVRAETVAPAKQKKSEAAPKRAAPSKKATPQRRSQPQRRATPQRQSQPSRRAAPQRQTQPTRRATPQRQTQPTRRATPSRSQPSRAQPSRTQPSKTQPSKAQPAQTRPSRTEPAQTRPKQTQPKQTQPTQTRPTQTKPAQTKPAQTRPTQTRPVQTRPSQTRPAQTRPTQTRPTQTRPAQTRPTQTPSRPVDRPVDRPVTTGTTGTTGTKGTKGSSPGVVRRSVSAGKVAPRVRKEGKPDGFEIDQARQNYISRLGGGKRGVDGRMSGHPDELDDHHGDDDHGHHDDDHYYDDHHDDWHIDIDINFWSHPTYCPGGWWYVYSDFNNDGYTDYVCTNGSYSVYWYGWSGAYWDCSPWYGWYSNRYDYRWWRYSIPDRYHGVVYGVDDELVDEPGPPPQSQVDVEIPQAVPLSAVEVARLEMSLGQPEVAIEAYRAHLSVYPSDWLALRELGLAMIRSGQRGDGVAIIGYAYSQDPLLAYDIIPVELFSGDAHELRDAVIRVVGWGHRNPSASAWLSVAALMQGEGRNGPALKMIERAEQLGLDSAIADQMRAALTQR